MPGDLTMHQNIYYFREQEQTALFEHLSGFLAPGGTLLVTTAVRTGQLSSATLDLWGAMSEGTSRLPALQSWAPPAPKWSWA